MKIETTNFDSRLRVEFLLPTSVLLQLLERKVRDQFHCRASREGKEWADQQAPGVTASMDTIRDLLKWSPPYEPDPGVDSNDD